MAGTHGIGYCRLVIEDAKGNTLRDDDELFVVSRAGRPDTGNWITVVNLGRFFVDRVEFVPEDVAKTRNFIYPVLYLRPAGARRTTPIPEPPRTPAIVPKGDPLTRKVIPLDINRTLESAQRQASILPAHLVANLVTVGYRIQASLLDEERRAMAITLQSSDERLRDAMVDVLDTLAREAKSNAVQCQLLFSYDSTEELPAADIKDKTPSLILIKGGAGDWQVEAA